MERIAKSLLASLFLLLSSTPSQGFDATLDFKSGKLQVFVDDSSEYDLSNDDIVRWVQRSGDIVSRYYDGFPMAEAFVAITGNKGKGVLHGIALGGTVGVVNVNIGLSTDTDELNADWILIHELIHLAFPKLHKSHHWIEEGLSVYVEAIARAQVGYITAEAVWSSFSHGMPNGLPNPGERGLDHTPTWGRVYWGGALFFLLADMEIIKRSGGKKTLRDGLRAIVANGLNITKQSSPREVFTIADDAIGFPILLDLYERMGTQAMDVDLDRLWSELGIVPADTGVTLVEGPVLTWVRKAITSPTISRVEY